MARLRKWRPMVRPARDFLCSLAFVSGLFAIMAPAGPSEAPIPVLSLVAEAFAGPQGPGGAPAALGLSPAAPTLSQTATPLISTVLAFMFASMITLSFGLMRYLRRANASSRHRLWREG